MLETIRVFGLEQLGESGEEGDARYRQTEFFRHLVAKLDHYVAFPGDESWCSQVAPEEDNLRQALEHFLACGDSLGLSELSSGVQAFWLTGSQFSEERHWMEVAIAARHSLD